MSSIRRYEVDQSAPTLGQARHDLARRTLAPAGLLWLANLVVGSIIVGPLDALPAEQAVNEELVDRRTPLMDVVTQVWSNIGGTHFLIAACVVVAAVLWWRTRQWWLAVVPAVALSLQSAVFVTSSLLVGRRRPDVEHLDVSPPTSAFPSGHTGASTAFYLVLALLAQRIRSGPLRALVTTACLLVPVLVAFSRMYRGMHHLSDVVAGLINGAVCAWLAWRYLRRRDGTAGVGGRGRPSEQRVTASHAPPAAAVRTSRDGHAPTRTPHSRRTRAP